MILELLVSIILQPNEFTITAPHLVEVAEAHTVPHEILLRDEVKAIVEREGIDWELVDRLITCESNWDETADNGADRGLWQINRKTHPNVTDEEALDPIWATKWAIQKYKDDGDFSAWTCANCVSYIRAYHYPNMPKMRGLVPNTARLQEGSVAIFNYTAGKHVAYVDSISPSQGFFTVKECNYKGGMCGKRNVSYTDPFLYGLWMP